MHTERARQAWGGLTIHDAERLAVVPERSAAEIQIELEEKLSRFIGVA